MRGADDKRVRVFVVIDRLIHQQFANRVAVLRDLNESGCLLVVCDGSMDENRSDLVSNRSENDELQASGMLEILRRFSTCRDHRRDSFLLMLLFQQRIPTA